MKKPNSSSGYWVREQEETEWKDASPYVKYSYGKFYDEEDVATAYLNYLHDEKEPEINECYIEVLNKEDKISTFRAYTVPSISYYADQL